MSEKEKKVLCIFFSMMKIEWNYYIFLSFFSWRSRREEKASNHEKPSFSIALGGDVRRIQLGCYSKKASVHQQRDTPCIGSVMLFIVLFSLHSNSRRRKNLSSEFFFFFFFFSAKWKKHEEFFWAFFVYTLSLSLCFSRC